MDKPKIVGLVNLEIPIVRRLNVDESEKIAHVGFDTDGQAWGLVARAVRLEEVRGDRPGNIFRVTFVRWVRFNAIPFAADEIVEPGAVDWQHAPSANLSERRPRG